VRISQADYDALVKQGCVPALDKPKREKLAYKSKAEQQFAWELGDWLKLGNIDWWAYEPMGFRLGDPSLGKRGVVYWPDFAVLMGGRMEFLEVKGGGYVRDKARVKFLAARKMYPQFTWRMLSNKHGTWEDIL
jgi:hypothetical protein